MGLEQHEGEEKSGFLLWQTVFFILLLQGSITFLFINLLILIPIILHYIVYIDKYFIWFN